MRYIVLLSHNCGGLDFFAAYVEKYIKEGWTPLGGATYSNGVLAQAMVSK